MAARLLISVTNQTVIIVYNNDVQYEKVKADSIAGTQDTYTITYVSANTTDESYSGLFVPTGMSDAHPLGDKVETTISFNSSGAIARIAPVA